MLIDSSYTWYLTCVYRPPREAVNAFVRLFITTYRGHGGIVVNTDPVIQEGGTNGAKAVENLFNAVGNANKFRPQLMFFILQGRNPEMYNRIKKSADCRFGVVSQCVQAAHLQRNQPQYHSNVCMKVNAKLGGTTCKVHRVCFILLLRPSFVLILTFWYSPVIGERLQCLR